MHFPLGGQTLGDALHHLQLTGVGEVPWCWTEAGDVSLDIDVGTVDKPLLCILQHLVHDRGERRKLSWVVLEVFLNHPGQGK